ncbi:MAG TPA: biotin-dependent carboxyltransferase family protein [Gemmatimonadales bacterium]|nr:biotin-dependent carboxyltransferase family protein [Gemmatimonadales bacterium]
MITIVAAPPFATVQDTGRQGHRAAGVPPGGAMDPVSLAAGNLLVGNPPDAAAIEWYIGAGELRFDRPTRFTLTGAAVTAELSGRPAENWQPLSAAAGDVLRVDSFTTGAWLYFSVAGGVAVPLSLGSRSTYLPAHFGGLQGRLLRTGDQLPLGASPRHRDAGPVSPTAFAASAARTASLSPFNPDPIAVMPGPARQLLPIHAWARLLSECRLSPYVSRMGYRFETPLLPIDSPPDSPSVPSLPGSVQLPPGGAPIVLMNDGPTVGGYPVIAVVATADLGRLAQRRPGEPVRFVEITRAEARARFATLEVALARLAPSP